MSGKIYPLMSMGLYNFLLGFCGFQCNRKTELFDPIICIMSLASRMGKIKTNILDVPRI